VDWFCSAFWTEIAPPLTVGTQPTELSGAGDMSAAAELQMNAEN